MVFILKTSVSFIFALFLILGVSSALVAQSVNPDRTQKTKWQGLSGKEDEFYFLIPEGFQAVSEGYKLIMPKDGKIAQVDSLRILSRYINGAVLILEFYEGDAKGIETTLTKREKGQLAREELINDFQFKSYVEKTPDFVWETQYFSVKKHLYVLRAGSRDGNNQIVRNFLESVRLINTKQVAAPNATKNLKLDSLPVLSEITENIPERLDDSQPQDKPDRGVIIFYNPGPKLGSEARSDRLTATVKLRALFSSSGKITKVEVVSSPGRQLKEVAIKAAERIQFVPAEKDGKLISIYRTVEYGFLFK